MFAETRAGFPARVGPRYVSAILGRVTIWRPFKPISLNFFNLGQGWRTFLRANAVTADNSRRNSPVCGNKVYWHHISDYSSDVLASHIFWHPGRPTPVVLYCCSVSKILVVKSTYLCYSSIENFIKIRSAAVHLFHTTRRRARAISTSKM